MTARNALAVALGAGIGALLRWAVSGVDGLGVTGSLAVVNAAGCLLVGWLLNTETALPANSEVLLRAGVCGALTTFSGVVVETATRLDGGRTADAAVLLGTVGLGACVGYLTGATIARRRSPDDTAQEAM